MALENVMPQTAVTEVVGSLDDLERFLAPGGHRMRISLKNGSRTYHR